MKFSALSKGTRAVRRVVVPGLTKENEDGTQSPVELGIRPLTGAEYADAVSQAKAYAKAHGAESAAPGDALYDMAMMAHTLVVGALDVDSPEADPKPFFDSGAEPLLAHLGIETIAYLYEQHELWQSECSPYAHKLTPDELVEQVREVTGPQGERSFMRMSPAMRWIFTHSLAVQFLSSLERKSSGGSNSEATTPTA